MPTQAEQLPNNIDTMMNKIDILKEKTFLTPGVPRLDFKSLVGTKRQIAKKLILFSAGAISVTGQLVEKLGDSVEQTITSSSNLMGNESNPNNGVSQAMNSYEMNFALNAAQMIGQVITPVSAHFIVYGKLKKDADGNLIDNEDDDPDCVFTKLAMPDDHPTFKEIMVLVSKVTRGLSLLGYKQAQLLDEVAQAAISIPASITAIAASAAILPPGAGIPVAFSAFQSMISTIMNLVSKISELQCEEIQSSLSYVGLLIQGEAQQIDAFIGLINAQILAINAILDAIDGITRMIPSVPSPPGLGNTPPDPLVVEYTILPTVIMRNDLVNIKCTANKGSWEYTYSWSYQDEIVSTDDYLDIDNILYDMDIVLTVTDSKGSQVVKEIPIRLIM